MWIGSEKGNQSPHCARNTSSPGHRHQPLYYPYFGGMRTFLRIPCEAKYSRKFSIEQEVIETPKLILNWANLGTGR